MRTWVIRGFGLVLLACSTHEGNGGPSAAGTAGVGAGTTAVGGQTGAIIGGGGAVAAAGLGGNDAHGGAGASAGTASDVGGTAGSIAREPQCTDADAGRGNGGGGGMDNTVPSGWLNTCSACPNGTCDSHPSPFNVTCVGNYPCLVDSTFPFCQPEPSQTYCITTGSTYSVIRSWLVTCTGATPAFEYCPNGCGAVTGQPYYCL